MGTYGVEGSASNRSHRIANTSRLFRRNKKCRPQRNAATVRVKGRILGGVLEVISQKSNRRMGIHDRGGSVDATNGRNRFAARTMAARTS